MYLWISDYVSDYGLMWDVCVRLSDTTIQLASGKSRCGGNMLYKQIIEVLYSHFFQINILPQPER